MSTGFCERIRKEKHSYLLTAASKTNMIKTVRTHINPKEEPIVDADPYSCQMTTYNFIGSGRMMCPNQPVR